MKKHTNLIRTDWRNYTALGESMKKVEKQTEIQNAEANVSVGNFNVANVKPSLSRKALNSGGNRFPGLSKFHNSPNKINKRFKNTIKNKLAMDTDDYENFRESSKSLSKRDYNLL